MRTWRMGWLVAGLLACGGTEDGTDDGSPRDLVLVEVEPGTDPGPVPWDVPALDPGPDCGDAQGMAGQWQPCETNCDCAPGPGVFCYGEAYTAPHKMCLTDKTQAGDCPPDPNDPGRASKYLNFNNSNLTKYALAHKALCFPLCTKDEDCTKLNPALTYCANGVNGTRWDEATLSILFTCQVQQMSPD